jgi:hypothetical protein
MTCLFNSVVHYSYSGISAINYDQKCGKKAMRRLEEIQFSFWTDFAYKLQVALSSAIKISMRITDFFVRENNSLSRSGFKENHYYLFS